MADDIKRDVGRYWLLYYQPRPEDGERIALALIIEEDGRARLHFDSEFSKIRRLFPATDVEGLRFVLENLRSDLVGVSEISSVLGAYGPQIIASSARKIILPISNEIVLMLLEKYILPAQPISNARRQKPDPIAERIEKYIFSEVAFRADVKKNVGSKEILGRKIPGISRVALAIPQSSGWTLIDGIDLNKLTPQAAIKRADDVAHTYWNYGRVGVEKGMSIHKVGVVLNGNSHHAQRTHEAHDYALHRFRSESDLTVDSASTESKDELASLLRIQAES